MANRCFTCLGSVAHDETRECLTTEYEHAKREALRLSDIADNLTRAAYLAEIEARAAEEREQDAYSKLAALDEQDGEG